MGGFVKTQQCGLLAVAIIALVMAAPARAQMIDAPTAQPGSIVGTVTGMDDGDIAAGATVVLQGPDPGDSRTATTNDAGYFEFQGVKPGVVYHVTVSAQGFKEWTSGAITIEPGQKKVITDSQLKIQEVMTVVSVSYTSEEIATEQVKVEEKQRVLGIIPNFYVVYEHNPEPLTAKLKFRLAFKVIADPITVLGVGFLSGVDQAADTPDYVQGAKGYGQRVGANAADGVSDILSGGAILPSLLHQDPRYFYQGTGSTRSRMMHALSNPFVCKGDNGKWQPNYSSVGGDLASSALSNAYYPQSNRGAGLVFENFAISTTERMVSSLLQEFVLSKLTPKAKEPK